MIKHTIKLIIQSIYPKKCICCGGIIDESLSLCECCEAKIERIDLEEICLDCGLEKSLCCCKFNVYRFNGLISVFKNEGIAKKAYYSYKFQKRQHYADFFADKLVFAIQSCYQSVEFDMVCYVPSYSKREYNHSGYIAQLVSNKLNIPLCEDLLSCIIKCKKQHKSTIQQRLSNVYGKYVTNYRIDGKRVLLIDDIKTTGATLDECSKELLFAGADSVYCATVLGSVASKNKIEKS